MDLRSDPARLLGADGRWCPFPASEPAASICQKATSPPSSIGRSLAPTTCGSARPALGPRRPAEHPAGDRHHAARHLRRPHPDPEEVSKRPQDLESAPFRGHRHGRRTALGLAPSRSTSPCGPARTWCSPGASRCSRSPSSTGSPTYAAIAPGPSPSSSTGSTRITVFVGSGFLGRILLTTHVADPSGAVEIPLQAWIFRTLFLPLASPINASLIYAITWILGWYVVLWLMYRKGIIWKV